MQPNPFVRDRRATLGQVPSSRRRDLAMILVLIALAMLALVVLVAAPLWAQDTPGVQGSFDANGQCVGDQNGDGAVAIEELVAATNNAVDGCQTQPVTLQFRAMVGDQTFACGNTYTGVGTTGAEITPADFRLYLHDVRLVTAAGVEVPLRLEQDGAWQSGDVVLLDFENKVRPCNNGTTATNMTVRGTVPPGEYAGLRFAVGVPFGRNHLDPTTAPSPLNLTGMLWSWQDGYKFIRIDTAFDNFRMHLGSVGCFYERPGVIGACTRPNRPQVSLTDFDPQSSVVVIDLAALLADSDITANQTNTPPGCMSDPDDGDCAPVFRNLGINFTDGSPTPQTQTFFRVE